MTVGLNVDNIVTEVGAPSFFHAFFSTISVRLEPNGWGSRFPVLLKSLYAGRLPATQIESGIVELRLARKELKKFRPEDIVWDIENRNARPPWGSSISPAVTDPSNYFVTSHGNDLFQVLEEVLDFAASEKKDVLVE
ncbi:immunity 70 family protein [Stenotrophobium rhamnosiphilum]|uniref:Immunity protein 70 n=1 Tax=Stenotrophobium rhamnosiphilum TaxID=2029166 RepID=A0A2T5MCT3_9GAMM|nr:immunity 70 family protein [Stenotrophobium rhamnosiphilum]PTU30388.1 hypothetical protein CJD38_15725 [Stenotrophobium rhamnosiphilum]